jgi:hypothetical protein
MVYLASQGAIQESTRKELLRGIDVRLQTAITNMTKLGVDLATKKSNQLKHSKETMKENKIRAQTIPMALMRYVPLLHDVVSKGVACTLNVDDYPYTSPPPANHKKGGGKVQSKRPPRNWRQKDGKDPAAETDNRPLFIVFVLGGVTFSELRSIYEIAEGSKVNLYVGSTNTLIASEFIQGLAELSTKQFISSVKASARSLDCVIDDGELPDRGGHDQEGEGADRDDD